MLVGVPTTMHTIFYLHFESCLGKPHYCHCSAAGHARLGMMLHTLMRSTPCGRDTPGTPALGSVIPVPGGGGGVDIEQSRLNKFNFNQRRLRWNAVASLILASPTLKLNKHQLWSGRFVQTQLFEVDSSPGESPAPDSSQVGLEHLDADST